MLEPRSEVVWRVSVLLIALAVVVEVLTRWNRWQDRSGWQTTDDE
jgi:hypothetical protein